MTYPYKYFIIVNIFKEVIIIYTCYIEDRFIKTFVDYLIDCTKEKLITWTEDEDHKYTFCTTFDNYDFKLTSMCSEVEMSIINTRDRRMSFCFRKNQLKYLFDIILYGVDSESIILELNNKLEYLVKKKHMIGEISVYEALNFNHLTEV